MSGNANRVVLFGEKAAGVYRMTDIFFPDEENPITPEESGKIVPAVGSLVIDDTKGLHNQQYTVVSVDPDTYFPTLIPSSFSTNVDSQPDRVLNYANDLLILYFMPTTIEVGQNTIEITRLIVDNKFSLFGNNAAIYQLFKYDDNSALKTISRWYTPDGIMSGTAIPMLDTGVNGVRKCDGCYTDISLKEGESIICRIYTAAGIQISEVNLVAKKAHMLNEIASLANPIIDLQLSSNQLDLDTGKLYLYQGQNVNDLTLYPYLKYSDGSTKRVAIDNVRGFIYGTENVDTSIPDMEFRLLIKYYLSDDDVQISDEARYRYDRTPDTTWKNGKIYYRKELTAQGFTYIEISSSTYTIGDPITDNDVWERYEVPVELGQNSNAIKFISKEFLLRIVAYSSDEISKVSIIPVWNTSERKYTFKFMKYMGNMKTSPIPTSISMDVTNYVAFAVDGYTLSNLPYDRKLKGTITYKEQVAGSYNTRTQVVYLQLKEYDGSDAERYLIADSEDSDRVFGSNSNNHVRPRIKYDSSTGKYKIPNEYIGTQGHSNKDVFLDNFYYQAQPPTINGRIQEPNRFRIKDINGNVIKDMQDVESFTTPFTFEGDSNGSYIDKTVIVEFVRKETEVDIVGNTVEVYYYIYGVPVDVVA